MAVCLGCGGSYEDAFNFCPYCGRAKPEPPKAKLERRKNKENRQSRSKVFQLFDLLQKDAINKERYGFQNSDY